MVKHKTSSYHLALKVHSKQYTRCQQSKDGYKHSCAQNILINVYDKRLSTNNQFTLNFSWLMKVKQRIKRNFCRGCEINL